MMSFFKILCFTFFISLICSCEKDGLPDEGFYTVPEEHLAWFPFEENEVLIFKDENGISTSYLGSKISQDFNYNKKNSSSDIGTYYTQSYSKNFSSYTNYFHIRLTAPSPEKGTELYLSLAGLYLEFDLDNNLIIRNKEYNISTTPFSLTDSTRNTSSELLESFNTGVKTYSDVLHFTFEYSLESTKTDIYFAKNKGLIQYTLRNGITSTLQE